MSPHALSSTIYIWWMCAAHRAASDVESCLCVQTKVTRYILCFCLMRARKWKRQRRLWFTYKAQIKVQLQVRCNRFTVVCLKGSIFTCEVWSWTFVAHCWVSMCEHTLVCACDCTYKLQYVATLFWLVRNVKRKAKVLCLTSHRINKSRICCQLWHLPSSSGAVIYNQQQMWRREQKQNSFKRVRWQKNIFKEQRDNYVNSMHAANLPR